LINVDVFIGIPGSHTFLDGCIQSYGKVMPNKAYLSNVYPIFYNKDKTVITDSSTPWEEFLFLPFMNPEEDTSGALYIDKNRTNIIRKLWFKSPLKTRFLLFKPTDNYIELMAESIYEYSDRFSHNQKMIRKKFNRARPFVSTQDAIDWINLISRVIDNKYKGLPEFNIKEWQEYNDRILVKELIK